MLVRAISCDTSMALRKALRIFQKWSQNLDLCRLNKLCAILPTCSGFQGLQEAAEHRAIENVAVMFVHFFDFTAKEEWVFFLSSGYAPQLLWLPVQAERMHMEIGLVGISHCQFVKRYLGQ